jgi:hypothetical protein
MKRLGLLLAIGIYRNSKLKGGFIDLLKRAAISFGIMWIGFHVIGLGMIDNGSNIRGNPAWDFLSALFDFELWLLKAGVLVAGVIFLVPVVYNVIDMIFRKRRHKKEKLQSKILESAVTIERLESHIVDSLTAAETKPIPEIAVAVAVKQESPRPVIVEKSPEELKQKAIEQLLRGW